MPNNLPTDAELEAILAGPEPHTRGQNVTVYEQLHGNTTPENVTVYELPDTVTPPAPQFVEVDGVAIRVATPEEVERLATSEARKQRREYQRRRRMSLSPTAHELELLRRREAAKKERHELTPEDLAAEREYQRVKQARYRARLRAKKEAAAHEPELPLSSSPPVPTSPFTSPPAPPAKVPTKVVEPDRRTITYQELDALVDELTKHPLT